jgi:hypothetical protein
MRPQVWMRESLMSFQAWMRESLMSFQAWMREALMSVDGHMCVGAYISGIVIQFATNQI